MKKKLFLMILMVFAVCACIFASDNEEATAYEKADMLLATNKQININGPFIGVVSYADKLSPEEKMSLYVKYRKKPALYLILNGVGFGIGSWVQGDIAGGLIGTVLDGGGLALTIIGSKKAADYYSQMKSETSTSKDTVDNFLKYLGISSGGIALMLASRAITILKASKRVERYNDFLSTALRMVQSVTVLPTINENGNIGASLSGKVSF